MGEKSFSMDNVYTTNTFYRIRQEKEKKRITKNTHKTKQTTNDKQA